MIDINLFHFLRPFWFLALIPVIILLWRLRKRLYRGDNWQQVIDKHLLPHLLVKSANSQRNWWFYILALIWIIAIFALAGPTWSKLPQPVYRSEAAKLIVLDLSPAMLAADIKPNRIERAKYKVLDILKDFPDGQTGMIVFSSEAYIVSPLTNDSQTIAALVPVLTPEIMPVSGSNIAVALTKAEELMQQAGEKSGNIILLTASDPTANALSIARKLNSAGYKLSVLGIGTKIGAPIPNGDDGFMSVQGQTEIAKLNIKALEQLAAAGGGRFTTFTNNAEDINYLLDSTLNNLNFTHVKKAASTDLWQDQGHWFILLLLLLVLWMFRRGIVEEIFK